MAIEDWNIYLKSLIATSKVKYIRAVVDSLTFCEKEGQEIEQLTQVVAELHRSATTAATILTKSGASLSALKAAG
jgi:hypothetical protein